MNYQLQYDNLIAIGRQLGTKEQKGFDLHHVIPSCMGGSDDKSNKVLLAYRAHFLAHKLLARINPGHPGCHYAVWRMVHSDGKYLVSARAYETARLHRSKLLSEQNYRTATVGKLGFQTIEAIAATRKRNNLLIAENKHPFQMTKSRVAGSKRAKQVVQCTECCLYVQKLSSSQKHFKNCRLLLNPGTFCYLSEADQWLSCLKCGRWCNGKKALGRHLHYCNKQ